jgi:hypothetical protein
MKKIVVFIVALGIILTAEGHGVEKEGKKIQRKPNLIKYEFPKVDSDRTISFDHIIFSPITKKVIWILNINGISYELYPESGKWKSLEPVLGKFAWGLSGNVSILKDNISKNIAWLGNFHKGVLLYDIPSGSKIIFDNRTYFRGNAITKIQPDSKCVWLGTSGGLFCYLRGNKNIIEIEDFNGIWIRSINVEKDRLWINGEYIYYPETKKIIQIYEYENWLIPEVQVFKFIEGYKIFWSHSGDDPIVIMDRNDKIIATLSEVPMQAITIDKGRNLWLCGGWFNTDIAKFSLKENRLIRRYEGIGNILEVYDWKDYLYFRSPQGFGRFNKSTGEVEIYPDGKGNFIADEEYFWILSKESIIQMSKVGSEKLFKPLLDIKQVEERIWNLGRAVTDEKYIINRIKKAAEFFALISINKNIQGLSQIEYFVELSLRTRKSEDIQLIKDFLNNTNIKPLEKEIGYYILATSPLVIGDPDLSCHYYDILKKEFPDSKFLTWIRKDDLQKLENARQKFKEINSKDIPEDKKLWLLGNLFFEAMQVSWNQVEVGYDYNYAFEFFKNLIKKYPHSKWADDAEFKMLSYYEGLVHEGGEVSLSCIDKYEEFMQKYPNSELVSAAKLEIGDHYYWFVNEMVSEYRQYMKFSEIKDYLDKAKVFYSDVVSLSTDTQYTQKAMKRLEEADKFLDKYSWVLELSVNSLTYFVGDSVIISFKLKNMRNTDKEIKIYKNLPNFGIEIKRTDFGQEYRWDKVPFIRDVTIQPQENRKTIRVISANGGEFLEEHKIQRLTINATGAYGRWEYGKFKLDKEGTYKVKGFYKNINQNVVIVSNEISFSIKKK